MKRFLLLLLRIWRQQLKLYLLAALAGAVIGVFILAPSYDYISARESSVDPLSSVEYMLNQVSDMLMGRISRGNLMLLVFYAEIGALLGIFSMALYKVIHERFVQIDYLKTELDKDLPSIIRQGEGPYLEFKSSLRWDMAESRINRALEGVVLKTLAGFLNSPIGGTLLIGVADDGEVIGLEKDYQTLKRPDQDKHVCRLIVSPANRPVFIEQGNTQKFYVRTGGATRDLNIKEALDFIGGRWKAIK
jgi:hypothetical protein